MSVNYLNICTIGKHLFWATKRRHFTPELTINTETRHLIGQKYLTTQSEWMKSTVSGIQPMVHRTCRD